MAINKDGKGKHWSLSSVGTAIIIAISILFSVLPIIRLILILSANGSNNLENDIVEYILPMEKILTGTYHWQNIFTDTFKEGHLNIFPVLAQVVLAKFSDWNVFDIIYFGIFLALLKLVFLFDALTFKINSKFKWFLLPILSFLLFSVSQISTYEHDFVSMEMGLCQLGLILGIWGLIRFSNQWAGIAIMILGGTLATWSWAGGPIVWPAFLLGLVLMKIKNPKFYGTWLAGFLITCFPYFYFLSLKSTTGQILHFQEVHSVSFFNWYVFIQALGWPFSQGFSPNIAFHRGIISLIIYISGILLLWKSKNKASLQKAVPALLLITYSLLNIYQISIFRETLAPWYSYAFMPFWAGLAGVAIVLLQDRKQILPNLKVNKLKRVNTAWVGIFLITLSFFYLTSNITFADKSFFLRSRTPASASCLRNFLTAPTYCETSLFVGIWGQLPLFYQLAFPLYRENWSVFGKKQRWTLQGDYFLGLVKKNEVEGIPPIFWTSDQSNVPTTWSWAEYRKLNLFLHSPNSIEWAIDLPSNLKKAIFHTGIAISSSAPYDLKSNGIIFQISIEKLGEPPQYPFIQLISAEERNWKLVSIPLTQYAGEKIILRLGSKREGNLNNDWGMYKFPYIDLILDDKEGPKEKRVMKITPKNTNLFEGFPSEENIAFFDSNAWKTTNVIKIGKNEESFSSWRVTGNPEFLYQPELNLCLNNFSKFFVSLKIPRKIYPRATRVYLQLNDQDGFQREFYIPLLPDNQMHSYTYDLELLDLPNETRLTGIMFSPIEVRRMEEKVDIKISTIGFLPKENPVGCQ